MNFKFLLFAITSGLIFLFSLPASALTHESFECNCPLCCGKLGSSSLAMKSEISYFKPTGFESSQVLSSSRLSQVFECKLSKISPSQSDDGSQGSVGFPRNSDLAPSLGSRKGIVIHIDFPDVQATKSQISTWKKRQISTAENHYKMASYGKYKLKLDSTNKVYRISNDSNYYNLGFAHDAPNMDGAKTREIVFDAMRAADADVDFSKYDFVVVATPKSPSIQLQGTIGAPSTPVDGAIFSLAILAPFDAITENGDAFKNTWLTHNIGHVLGLMHGFRPDYSNGTRPAAWDIMWNFAAQDDFIGWNKWKLGWINDKQVLCLDGAPSKPVSHLLSPISEKSKKGKLVVIKLDQANALVVEVRRKNALDQQISKRDEGVIVYKVDTSQGSNLGAYQIVSKPGKQKFVWGGFKVTVGTMKPGESYNFNGIKIKVTKSSLNGDLISISK